MTMGAGLFTALQYETMQKTQGEALAEFLQKLGIAVPDFLTGDAYALSSSLNDEIASKLCDRLRAKTLRKGCEQLLAIANLPAPRSNTNEDLFARIAEHREDILVACKAKPPQSEKISSADGTSHITERPQTATERMDGQAAPIFQKHPALAGVGAAVVAGSVAAVAGASAGVVVTVGSVAGVTGGAVAHHLKQTATNAGRRAKQFSKKASIRTNQISPDATEPSSRPLFSWDSTRLDELAETLDIIIALSSLAAASHRS